jgi:DNA polymerase-3 subunit chi
MTRIDFYLNAESKLQIACRIAAKAVHQKSRVLVLAPDESVAREIDRLMWSLPSTGFLPHCLASDPLAGETPVLITRRSDVMPHDDVLLNLGDQTPGIFSRFRRLIEIVGLDEGDKATARARFRFYKDRGYELMHHDLGGN